MLHLPRTRADELPVEPNELKSLTPKQAKNLAQREGQVLYLNGLASLSEDAAKALAQYNGYMYLNGLTTLSDDAVKALAQHKIGMSLDGLTTLSDEASEALSHHAGFLWLSGLATVSDKAAKSLSQHKGPVLSLNGLTQLSAEAAKALAAAKSWDGYLPKLTVLDTPQSIAIARALSNRRGPLSIPNLKKISPKALSALVKKEDVEIPLIEKLELIPEPDGSPTEDFVIPEGFIAR